VVIDSASSYLDRGLKSNNEQDVRDALLPLTTMAQSGVTILASLHVNKSSDAAGSHRVLGSVAWRNISRSVLIAGQVPDTEDEYGLGVNKANLGRRAAMLGYQIETARALQKVGSVRHRAGTARLVWSPDPLDLDVDDLLPQKKRARGRGRPADERAIAKAFLEGELADGPVRQEHLMKRAAEEGISERTLRRAKDELGVRARNRPATYGGWIWELPEDGQK
jgi:putative DNA primase/helicase